MLSHRDRGESLGRETEAGIELITDHFRYGILLYYTLHITCMEPVGCQLCEENACSLDRTSVLSLEVVN